MVPGRGEIGSLSGGSFPSLTVRSGSSSSERNSDSGSSVAAVDPRLDRALPSPCFGAMAWVSSESRSISPNKMPRDIRELLVLLVLNSAVISCCF